MGDARDACGGCGTPLPDGARFCGRCGRTRDDARSVTVVELGRVDAPAVQTAVVASHAAARRPLPRVAVAAVALVVAGAAGVWALTAGDDGRAGEATSPPTTSVPVDGAELTSTSAPASTAAPSSSAAPFVPAPGASPSTSSTTTTTIPYVNQRAGVVLDAEHRTESIYVSRSNTLSRVDLGTGRVSSRLFADTGVDVLGLLDGRVLFRLGNTARVLWTLPPDLQGEPRALPLGDFDVGFTGATRSASLWLVRWPDGRRSDEAVAVRRVDAVGTVLTDITLPVRVYPFGYLADRVVVSQMGRIWTVGADGRAVPYAAGQVAAVTERYVLWAGCDDALRCAYRLGDATRPDLGRTGLETSFLFALSDGPGAYDQALSPDGATVVAGTAPIGTSGIVDLATGSVLPRPSGGGSLGWTTDGVWVIESLATTRGAVATNVRTGRTVALDHEVLGALVGQARMVVG